MYQTYHVFAVLTANLSTLLWQFEVWSRPFSAQQEWRSLWNAALLPQLPSTSSSPTRGACRLSVCALVKKLERKAIG